MSPERRAFRAGIDLALLDDEGRKRAAAVGLRSLTPESCVCWKFHVFGSQPVQRHRMPRVVDRFTSLVVGITTLELLFPWQQLKVNNTYPGWSGTPGSEFASQR